MALTKQEHENLLKEIAESGGDTDNMLKLMQRLRDDFNEREGILRKLGETKDKNEPSTKEEREEIRKESIEDDKEDSGLRRDPINYRDKYEKLRRNYINRYFSGSEEEKEEEEEKDKKKERKYEDLFKRGE